MTDIERGKRRYIRHKEEEEEEGEKKKKGRLKKWGRAAEYD
jgi:hypothetical protein